MRTPSVAVCMPSRGLIHSRTVAAVLAALTHASDHVILRDWLITHDLPIPDCHETLAERGLASGADWLWFVEEDMVPPADALTALLDTAERTGAGVVTLDYPVSEHPAQSCIVHQDTGGILFCGMGCTLIARDALLAIPRPWFASTHDAVLVRYGDHEPWQWVERKTPYVYAYGGQDIYFGHKAVAHGVRIVEVSGMVCGHAHLRARGPERTNHGAHTIDIQTTIDVRY